MGQAITDCAAFLTGAREALYRLECDKETARHLAAAKDEKEAALAAERRALSDEVAQTLKKRLESINAGYDREIEKGQERLKKARIKRERAKDRGVRERIEDETADLREEGRRLRQEQRTLFQKDGVPLLFRGSFYYSLYNPRGLREVLTAFAAFLLCFFAVPWLAYFLIPERSLWQLALLYFLDILLFGGLYLALGSFARRRFQPTLREGRKLRSALRANSRKIKATARAIRRDGREDLYNLEKYDDEIACAQQELEETAAKKKDALNTFESVTKEILTEEIESGYRERITSLEAELSETAESLSRLEAEINRQSLAITDTYGPYLDREFLDPDRLTALLRLIQSGQASTLTEAAALFRESQQRPISRSAGTPPDSP